MNKILVLKDVAYAAVSSGSAIATIADLDRLAPGAIAVFDQNGDIIAYNSLSGTYESLIFAAGMANDADGNAVTNITVPVPVIVDRYNVQAYSAPVKQVVQVGALITKQVSTVTLTGTSGTATVTCAGETDTATFDTNLTTTASNFVTANATAYLAAGVVLTSNGADLIMTAAVGGTAFTVPTITNATGDLAGTVVETTDNISGTTLQFDSTGEYGIVVLDNTYTNKYGVQRVTGAGYRQSYMSEENVVDDVVAKLNRDGSFVVATKTGNSTDGWGISITSKKYGVVMGVSVNGMFEGTPVYSDGTKGSTAIALGMGTSEIVKQMEKDFSVNIGNSNSIEYTEEYFPLPLETVDANQYEMINLQWKGSVETPSTKKTVANNRLVIAGVNGSTILDNVQTIISGILTVQGSKTVS